MPEGFTDEVAWNAIHWEFSKQGDGPSTMDGLMIAWQRENQDRTRAAAEARANAPKITGEGDILG